MSIYLLDTNFFIQAHRVSYPLDVALSFWNKVKYLAEKGKIISIDKVKNEIFGNNDTLKYWCIENLPESFFKDTSKVVGSYQRVVEWVISKSDHYNQAAINEFLDAEEADSFLIAYALTDPDNKIIVTQETSEPQRKSKVKLPDACIALNIHFTDTMGMLRQMGEAF